MPIVHLGLDLTTPIETHLIENGNATLKLDSVLVYGEDIRPNLELPEIQGWIRDRMHDGLGYLCSLRGDNSSTETYPLSYPDAGEECYGYAETGTKDFATALGWCASAILAYKLKTHVFRKSDCLELYRTQIADEWTTLVESIFEDLRGNWNYQIPSNIRDRRRFRGICEQALRFENHFLQLYREFLLEDLNSTNKEAKRLATSRLSQVFATDSPGY